MVSLTSAFSPSDPITEEKAVSVLLMLTLQSAAASFSVSCITCSANSAESDTAPLTGFDLEIITSVFIFAESYI